MTTDQASNGGRFGPSSFCSVPPGSWGVRHLAVPSSQIPVQKEARRCTVSFLTAAPTFWFFLPRAKYSSMTGQAKTRQK